MGGCVVVDQSSIHDFHYFRVARTPTDLSAFVVCQYRHTHVVISRHYVLLHAVAHPQIRV